MNRLTTLMFPTTVALALILGGLGILSTKSVLADPPPGSGPGTGMQPCPEAACLFYQGGGKNQCEADPDVFCDKAGCTGCEFQSPDDPTQATCDCVYSAG